MQLRELVGLDAHVEGSDALELRGELRITRRERVVDRRGQRPAVDDERPRALARQDRPVDVRDRVGERGRDARVANGGGHDRIELLVLRRGRDLLFDLLGDRVREAAPDRGRLQERVRGGARRVGIEHHVGDDPGVVTDERGDEADREEGPRAKFDPISVLSARGWLASRRQPACFATAAAAASARFGSRNRPFTPPGPLRCTGRRSSLSS